MRRFDELEQRLRRQELPYPPEALAGRIRAAADACPRPAALAWSDRLWYSRPARLGWAAAVLLLVAAEIAIAPRRPAPSRPERDELASQVADLAADLRLDPSWSARLAATGVEADAGPGRAELDAAVNAL